MPLNRDKCRLMTDDLIGRFENLERVLARVREELPKLWATSGSNQTGKDKPEFEPESHTPRELAEDLEEIRSLMERERYYVGFLGRSQIGKSSTLNRIVGYEIATSGAGKAATSTATRLYRMADEKLRDDLPLDEQQFVTLHFMNSEEYGRRKAELCKHLKLKVEDEAELLESLTAEIASMAAGKLDELSEDRKYFARLLRTYVKFGREYVREPRRSEPGLFTDRHKYTNHPEDCDEWLYLLLREVEIEFATQELSPKIELVDLPGLGARLAADDQLTLGYLRMLNGALVFQSTEHVAVREAYMLVTDLRKRFDNLKNRVWMVVTKFENLTEDHWGIPADPARGLAGRPSILDNLAKTLEENTISDEQALLVANEFHKDLGRPGPGLRAPVPADIRTWFRLSMGPDGQPEIPKKFEDEPVLGRAYREHVLVDGGIGRLRDLIQRELAELVEAEVRAEVSKKLERVRRGLAAQVSYAHDLAQMDTGSVTNVVFWETRLQQLKQSLTRDKDLENDGRQLKGDLLTKFQVDFCPPDLLIEADRLAEKHRRYAEALRDEALARSRPLLTRAYDKVSAGLKAIEAAAVEKRIGPVVLSGFPSPPAAWEGKKKEEMETAWVPRRGGGSWDSLQGDAATSRVAHIDGGGDAQRHGWYELELRALENVELFRDGEEVLMTDDDYRALMPKKIAAVVHQVVHTVDARIIGNLDRLERELAWIDRSKENVDRDDLTAYKRILDELGA
jgi:Dynamin family